MTHTTGIVLRWLGRALIVLGPVVLVGALFLPDLVQPLNPIVCREGLELDNARPALPNGPDPGLELVCVAGPYSESAGREVLLTAVTSITLGLVAIYFSQRMLRPAYHAPTDPGRR